MLNRIVVMSSFVASGSVGLRAALQVLTARGADVIALPTVLLSSHLGHAHPAGAPVAPETLGAMVDALESGGLLDGTDAFVSGFMPTVAHVELAVATASRIKSRNARAMLLVDPIMGDDPHGLYVSEAVADAIRTRLAGLADILTPNRFELARLTARAVSDIASATAAIAALEVDTVAATSIPAAAGEIATVLKTPTGRHVVSQPRLPSRAHGTGDVFAALLLAKLLDGSAPEAALRLATAGVARAIAVSGDALDLALARVDWRA